MRRLGLLVAVIFVVAISAFSKGSINYTLSMPAPHTHYFEVEMVLEGFPESQLDIKLPVWAPGSYLIREFPKNIDGLEVVSGSGKELKYDKISKNTWRVIKGKESTVVVKYSVYAYEMSVRTSFLDADHGYVNGTSIFMYVEGKKDLSHGLKIVPYKEWKLVSTALPEVSGEKWNYKAKDYDQLVDCPIEIGNHKEIIFEAAGIKHRIAMYGEGNYDEERLKTDLTKIIEGLTDIFGDNPNEEYLFIVHNLEKGSGGLEHKTSTTLQVNRWTYYPESKYQSFLGLAAHEYFHLWLVKRLRPETLGPFNYDEENYTTLLWVMEGFTSYYSQLILCQLGYMNEVQFINKLAESITGMENMPGNTVQPVSASSFDAWIKAYRPNENSSNTQVSYYQKGSVLAAILDVLIVNNSEGKHNLGSVLDYLYENSYQKDGSGISDSDMKAALEKFAAVSLDEFYAKYIDGTEEIDYQKFLGLAGLKVTKDPFFGEDAKKLGVSTSDGGGKVTVKSVQVGTPAYTYGLNADDEVVAIDGYRINSSKEINTLLDNREIGDELEIIVTRDGMLKTIPLVLDETKGYYYRISKDNFAGVKEEKTLKSWLTGK